MSARLAAPPVFASEAEFQRHVRLMAYDAGWGITPAASKALDADLAAYGRPPDPLGGLVYHPTIAYRSEPGWPDLCLIRRRDRRLIFAELKMDKPSSKLTPRQEKVLDLLRCLESDAINYADTTVQVFVWRPSDLPEIAEILR